MNAEIFKLWWGNRRKPYYYEECAFERLKKYIEELYEKQVKNENGWVLTFFVEV